jgi:hypothetical protein
MMFGLRVFSLKHSKTACLSGDMSKKQGLKLIHLKMEKLDATVAENLNTLMDDNKVLCLANGERVPLGSDVRIVIETSSC